MLQYRTAGTYRFECTKLDTLNRPEWDYSATQAGIERQNYHYYQYQNNPTITYTQQYETGVFKRTVGWQTLDFSAAPTGNCDGLSNCTYYTTDTLGRPVQESVWVGSTLVRQTSSTYVTSGVNTGMMNTVTSTANGNLASTFTYQADGDLASVNYGNVFSLFVGYDSADRANKLDWRKGISQAGALLASDETVMSR